MLTISELADFLQNAHWPRVPEHRDTFFSIAGIAHRENIMSNVYQFFFGTENPHGLGSLCIDALGDVIQAKQPDRLWPASSFHRAFVRREERTDNNKRLDLLLYNGPSEHDWRQATSLVLIENKIHHWLANDLGEYWQYVEPKNQTHHKIGIVLGLKLENIRADWQNNWMPVTHLEWAQAVEKRLGQLVYRAEPRYVTLLLELIENIRIMSNAQETAKELLRFFQQHYSEVQRINSLKDQLLNVLPTEIGRALSVGYNVENQADDAKAETWLTITSPISQNGSPNKYLIQYGGLFTKGVEPEYEIKLINHDHGKCEHVRQIYRDAQVPMVEYGNQHYVVSKTYAMTSSQSANFAEHIATSLRLDWMSSEHLWNN